MNIEYNNTGRVRVCVCAPEIWSWLVCLTVRVCASDSKCTLPSDIFQAHWSMPTTNGHRQTWSGKAPGPSFLPLFHHPSSIPGVSDGWTDSPAKDRAPLPHAHTQIRSPVWLMDVGALQLTLCCDKQQMFSNNVYRLGLHLQMTHTCFQSNRPREAIHPPCSGWPLHHCISPTMH